MLYVKFLKTKSNESEEKYKNCKYFENLKIKSNKNYYGSLLKKYKHELSKHGE